MDKKIQDSSHAFQSNAEMIRHYFKELMADGQEHSTKEINEYIHDKTNGFGVDGKHFTDETIHSAIWYIFRQDHDIRYMQTRKGFYQKTPANASLEKAQKYLREIAVQKLSGAAKKIRLTIIPGLPNQEILNSMRESIINEVNGVIQSISADGFGRELMTKDNIAVDSELIIEDDHVNAYISIWFDADKRFGLETADTDEYINLYADYYPADGRLDVYYIHRGADGEEIATKSFDDLTAGEKDLIIQLMKNEGMDELIADMSEEQESGMSMQ